MAQPSLFKPKFNITRQSTFGQQCKNNKNYNSCGVSSRVSRGTKIAYRPWEISLCVAPWDKGSF